MLWPMLNKAQRKIITHNHKANMFQKQDKQPIPNSLLHTKSFHLLPEWTNSEKASYVTEVHYSKLAQLQPLASDYPDIISVLCWFIFTKI